MHIHKTWLRLFFGVTTVFLSGCDTSLSPNQSFEVAVKGVHSSSISEDGSMAVIGSIHHGGSLWTTADQERHFNWNHRPQETTTIQACDFSFNGKWAVTADPHTIVLWNTATGQGDRFWTAPGEILDIELGPGANFALLGLDDNSAVIFDIRNGGIKRRFEHGNRVRSVDISQDGKLALTGSEDFTARVWDIPSGKQLIQIKHEDDVQLVEISDDGSMALSVSKYDKALLWNTDTGEAIGEIPLNAERLKRGLHFTAARFSNDNQLLLTGRPDQIVELWETATLRKIASWKLPKRDAWKPTSAAVIAVAFSSTPNHFLATASNGFIHHLTVPSE
ncbi:hypothetical protein [Teredinibacter sp. KSP-S5-2]|uniref:WD40 repeat domain-containing protein n=1 Tax=Teredinibacter sp. KSP-S5-2 TaxID=3034506 RepID=UPI002934EA2A|nr:hypothetical protein [Teredinibacter sp. KSP-S5-2]WNO08988.1 hypothetical protein P5V12_18745 [Teredinibacter sp. KSP-S5-2]